MNSLNKIVQSMYGSRRLEETASLADMDTQTYIGIATGDSEEGSVSVWLTDDVTQPDNGIWDGGTWVPADESDTSVVLPTTQSVHKGDRVLVSMFGGNTIATPVVTGVIGGGDSMRQDIDVVDEVASEAQAVAEAVNQHFWQRSTDPDGDGAGTGAFVTDEEQETFLDAMSQDVQPTTARPLHNLLMNAEGILLRAGKRIRAAFTSSGMSVYDGLGNAASNVLAVFSSGGIVLGKSSGMHAEVDTSGMRITDGTSTPLDISVVGGSGIISGDNIELSDSMTADGTGQFIGGILAGTTADSNYIKHVMWGTGNAITNSNGITTFNPSMGVKPSTVVVVMQHNAETEAIAKIAVPMIWSIDSATQVQVRWKRTDTNAWLTSNRVCWTWLAIA